jgi:elongator complex protein 3
MNDPRKTAWAVGRRTPFDMDQHGQALAEIIEEIKAAPGLSARRLAQILRRHPLPNGNLFSKDQILKGYRLLCRQQGRRPDPSLVRRLRVKPTRTISGVAPVTVLTEPYPCPGECIFCPGVEHMPKSYLPDEPGAMRAAAYDFDPFDQTAGRVTAMSELGHQVDKVELLILGGTWSSYPEPYQEWFVRRCLDALNGTSSATLEQAQSVNEQAAHRNVGLVIETRPDCITPRELHRLRCLGVTKVQLGIQSLDNRILAINRRDHTVADTRQAVCLLRLGGFKTVAHWMPNLLGATPESDIEDFRRLWDDPALRPDELKIYPTALLPGTELFDLWQQGQYRPYDERTLVRLLADCKALIPPYCRLNRLMRDIPAPNIVAGVKKTNLRQIVQQEMALEGRQCRCIRCREVRGRSVQVDSLQLGQLAYETEGTEEIFLSMVTPAGRLAGFLRLSLPKVPPPFAELECSAVIREVHVYGPALDLGYRRAGAVQHAGLGTQLLEEASRLARKSGYDDVAVIAAVGTRPYYEERGFSRGELYMHRRT